jgi:hypothetical protein
VCVWLSAADDIVPTPVFGTLYNAAPLTMAWCKHSHTKAILDTKDVIIENLFKQVHRHLSPTRAERKVASSSLTHTRSLAPTGGHAFGAEGGAELDQRLPTPLLLGQQPNEQPNEPGLDGLDEQRHGRWHDEHRRHDGRLEPDAAEPGRVRVPLSAGRLFRLFRRFFAVPCVVRKPCVVEHRGELSS